jgi:hypothetical protein
MSQSEAIQMQSIFQVSKILLKIKILAHEPCFTLHLMITMEFEGGFTPTPSSYRSQLTSEKHEHKLKKKFLSRIDHSVPEQKFTFVGMSTKMLVSSTFVIIQEIINYARSDCVCVCVCVCVYTCLHVCVIVYLCLRRLHHWPTSK